MIRIILTGLVKNIFHFASYQTICLFHKMDTSQVIYLIRMNSIKKIQFWFMTYSTRLLILFLNLTNLIVLCFTTHASLII